MTAVLTLAIAGSLAAQQVEVTSPPATALATSDSTITVMGTVVSSTDSELVIDTDAGARLTFAVDANTTRPTSFTAGERVSVQYHTLDGGLYHAANVAAAALAEELDEMEEDLDEVEEVEMAASPELPVTASPLALIGLLGLLAASGGLAVRAARRS